MGLHNKLFKKTVAHAYYDQYIFKILNLVSRFLGKNRQKIISKKKSAKMIENDWLEFQARVSHDFVIYNQKELSQVRLQACAYSLIK